MQVYIVYLVILAFIGMPLASAGDLLPITDRLSSELPKTTVPEGTVIHACGDGAGWPPYTYKIAGGSVAGYDVDVLASLLTKFGLKSIVTLEPWKRCLASTQSAGHFQMAVSSAYSAQRAKDYLFSDYYYSVTPSYFYSKNRFPEGLSLNSSNDFSSYQVCGLLGYNYANFGLPIESIDTGAKSFQQLVNKTINKRCDIFLARYEILKGFAAIGDDFVRRENLSFAAMPDSSAEKFYMLISKKYRYAESLKQQINTGLRQLRGSGQLRVLLQKNYDALGIGH